MILAKRNYNFRGTVYPLMMDLYALEKIEEEFGGMRKVQEEIRTGKQFQTIKRLFTILGNAALEDMDQPETLTGEEIRRATLDEIATLMTLIFQLIDLSGQTQTGDGEAGSDMRKELYEDEEDEKNA